MLKGFAMDDDRSKQGKQLFGKDYFDELLERIRDIRASERRFYQKITDIYTECSYDYDKNAPITKRFFAQAQNKHLILTNAIHNLNFTQSHPLSLTDLYAIPAADYSSAWHYLRAGSYPLRLQAYRRPQNPEYPAVRRAVLATGQNWHCWVR